MNPTLDYLEITDPESENSIVIVEDPAKEVRKLHSEITVSINGIMRKAWEAGQILHHAKLSLPHGELRKFESETGISIGSCQRYRELYELYPERANLDDALHWGSIAKAIREGRKLLAPPIKETDPKIEVVTSNERAEMENDRQKEEMAEIKGKAVELAIENDHLKKQVSVLREELSDNDTNGSAAIRHTSLTQAQTEIRDLRSDNQKLIQKIAKYKQQVHVLENRNRQKRFINMLYMAAEALYEIPRDNTKEISNLLKETCPELFEAQDAVGCMEAILERKTNA